MTKYVAYTKNLSSPSARITGQHGNWENKIDNDSTANKKDDNVPSFISRSTLCSEYVSNKMGYWGEKKKGRVIFKSNLTHCQGATKERKYQEWNNLLKNYFTWQY